MSFRVVVRTSVALVGVALLASCSDSNPTSVVAPRFSAVYVFGASLEDTGNSCNLFPTACPPAPPYAKGRSSNSDLWVEEVAKQYAATVTPSRTGGTNYAFGGARTGPIAGSTQGVPNMLQQVDLFVATPATAGVDRAKALFVIGAATVGNDITDALVRGLTNPAAPATIIAAAVTNTVTTVSRLYAAGARTILLMNSTDVGRTPLVRSQGAAAVAGASLLSAQFNTALSGQLASLRAASPGLTLVYFDFGALTAELFAAPATFGFTNVTTPCYVSAAVPPCTTPNAFLYWDGFHPTAATGRLMAQRALTALGN